MATNITNFTLTDNTELVKNAMEENIAKALERIGLFVEGEAKLELEKDPRRVDTGALRNSITHTVQSRKVIIGSNLDYAIYVHEGTGKYNSSGSTGDKYWIYVTGRLEGVRGRQRTLRRLSNAIGRRFHVSGKGKRYTYDEARKIVAIMRSEGLDAHMTNGMEANRFLRNAIMNNTDKIKEDFERTLKGQ